MSYFFENETRKERIKKPSQRLFCAQAGKYELHTHNKNQKEEKKRIEEKKSNEKKQFQIFTSLLKCEVLPDSVLSRWLLVGFFRVASVRWYCVYLLFFFSSFKKRYERHKPSEEKRKHNRMASLEHLRFDAVSCWTVIYIFRCHFGRLFRYRCAVFVCVSALSGFFSRKFGVPSIWYKTRRVSISKDWISQNRQRSRRNVFGVILCCVIVIATFILTSLVEI